MLFLSTNKQNESGLALLLVVFVIAFASLLVLELVFFSRFDLRASRDFAENIQSNFMLKSSVHLGQTLIEAPKLEDITEDWLGDPWALIAAAPSLPVSGFIGEPRLMIVDEEGKINLNAILETSTNPSNNPFPDPDNTNQGNSEGASYWKNTVSEIFTRLGYQRAQYPEEEHRTIGNFAFDSADQVATIHDWMDADSVSHSDATFNGSGIESGTSPTWFYNRPLRNLSELLLVPGMTLQRLSKIAPFVRVSNRYANATTKINVNTAPYEVLVAIGFPEGQASDMIQERLNLPFTNEILNTLVTGDTQLRSRTKVTSNEFTIYSRIIMPNGVHWVKANIAAQGSSSSRQTFVRAIEFY